MIPRNPQIPKHSSILHNIFQQMKSEHGRLETKHNPPKKEWGPPDRSKETTHARQGIKLICTEHVCRGRRWEGKDGTLHLEHRVGGHLRRVGGGGEAEAARAWAPGEDERKCYAHTSWFTPQHTYVSGPYVSWFVDSSWWAPVGIGSIIAIINFFWRVIIAITPVLRSNFWRAIIIPFIFGSN